MKLLSTIVGMLSGIAATGPMTAAMIALHRRLPAGERYPLPPREITSKVARMAGVKEGLSSEAISAATLLAHFGYGAATGAVYGALSPRLRCRPLPAGLGYGLLIWGASYLGLLPAAGILTPATEHPVRRSLLMIGVHLVWGAVLAWLVETLLAEARSDSSRPFSAPQRRHPDTR